LATRTNERKRWEATQGKGSPRKGHKKRENIGKMKKKEQIRTLGQNPRGDTPGNASER